MTSRSDISRDGVRRHGTAGFTLIEMIVVLAILGLALTLIISNGKAVSPATHARAAAEAISGALRAARSEAVMTNRSISLTLDLASRSYGRERRPPQILSNDIALTLLTSRYQLVAEAVGSIRFNPDGSSSGGRVSVEGGGRTWWIGIDWLSGRVSLAEKPR